ncbi:CRISPR-associated endonuclease Cas2 [Actinomyces vulturis]|uniref:CRISPR-associated endonuclease Cas2 n=1 Tax=Actinomyces vulturis TaxID=1857645 RepID=UPI00082ACFE9|nr:CRISPR-associated endonuclease Cas2 [Actinomyces vulturis]
MADDPMWCLVMFDLPTETKAQRRDANHFRNALLDLGFFRVQLSVYVRYNPSPSGDHARVKAVVRNLPAQGQVTIVYLSDTQWSKAFRFCNAQEQDAPETPGQLMFF